MGRREYDQPCSLASALDQIGERWSLLVVRELVLGPLRFSELARAMGGPPTDVLAKRLRDLEAAGVVRKVELDPPASATVYELTELGRGLERPLLELGRWGLSFHDPATVAEMPPAMLPNALRVTLRPPRDLELVLGLHTGDVTDRLAIADGWIEARRAAADDADITISGTPWQVMATLIAERDLGEMGASVSGDAALLETLRGIVDLPDAHRAGAEEIVAAAEAAVAVAT
jgi:DNA-binding HxlR family transcriptional regulator